MLMYYNFSTKEVLSKDELKNRLNISFSSSEDVINNEWYQIHFDEKPYADEFHYVDTNEYKLIDNVCYKTYKLVERELSSCKRLMLNKLNDAFNTLSYSIKSSLGFTIDADDVANRNLNGLLRMMTDESTVEFCDFDNNFHTLTKENVNTMLDEITLNAQNLYSQKWVIRTAIESAETVEELSFVTIHFNMLDFSM